MATREDIIEDLEGMGWFDTLTQEIEEKFLYFHSLLETRRVYLQDKVKNMRELYKEHQKSSEVIEQLDVIIRTTKEVLTASLIAGDKDVLIKTCDDRIEELKRSKLDLERFSKLKFVVNSEEFSGCVKRMHLREIEAMEYIKRREPLVMKGKRGYGEEEVFTPRGISFDSATDEVFIAEYHKDLVCVYSFGGNYIRKFGNKRLSGPCGICLSGKFLFVSSSADSVIHKFARTGEFVASTSLEGENAIQLKHPRGLCVHNEYVYVCNSGYGRIAVLRLDLTFVKNFGEYELKYPEDIKIFNNQIFVFTDISNSIDIFDANHNHLRSIHFTSQISTSAYFFTIDNKGNFIVSDYKAGCLKVFNPSGEYVETLGEGYLTLPLKVLP